MSQFYIYRGLKKYAYLGMLLLFAISCKEETKDSSIEQEADRQLNLELENNEIIRTPEVLELLENWKAFKNFDQTFNGLSKLKYREDLVLFIDNLLENEALLKESVYPELFNVPQIRSRQKVLKTFILKVKSALEYRLDPQPAMHEMIIAYQDLQNQFNIIVASTLSDDHLLDL